MPVPTESQRDTARIWFETLRDRLCAAFEALEDAPDTPLAATLPPAGSSARPGSGRAAAAV